MTRPTNVAYHISKYLDSSRTELDIFSMRNKIEPSTIVQWRIQLFCLELCQRCSSSFYQVFWLTHWHKIFMMYIANWWHCAHVYSENLFHFFNLNLLPVISVVYKPLHCLAVKKHACSCHHKLITTWSAACLSGFFTSPYIETQQTFATHERNQTRRWAGSKDLSLENTIKREHARYTKSLASPYTTTYLKIIEKEE